MTMRSLICGWFYIAEQWCPVKSGSETLKADTDAGFRAMRSGVDLNGKYWFVGGVSPSVAFPPRSGFVQPPYLFVNSFNPQHPAIGS